MARTQSNGSTEMGDSSPSHVGFLLCLQLLLEGPDDILAFEFCPSDPNIVVGGCINGQVLASAGGNRSQLNIHQRRLVFLTYSAGGY